MLAQCIALFLCSVGLPVVAVVGTVRNAANLENFILDTTGGSLMPVQYAQPQEPKPVSNNYVVLNPAYLGSDPLRSDILANSIVPTNNQQLTTTNQPPVPVDPMSTPSATQATNSIQEPPKQSGGMTFTVSSGPGTNSNLQTFGNPPLIIFAPQNPTPPIETTSATNSGVTAITATVGNTNPIGSNLVNTPTEAPTTGTNTVANTVETPTEPPSTPSSIRNPFGTNVPVTDPTFQFSGLPTIVSTLADPTTLNPVQEVAPTTPTFSDLTQILTSTKNPPTVFELQTGMPWNTGVLNQPTPSTSGTGNVVVDPSVNTPQPETQTTTPTQPIRNPFVPPVFGNPAPIDPQVTSSSQPNAVGSGSVTSTSTPSTNVGSPAPNSASNTLGSATTVKPTTSGPVTINIATGTVPATTTANGLGTQSSNMPAQTTQGTTGTQTPGVTPAITTNVPATVTDGTTVNGLGTQSSNMPAQTTQGTTGTQTPGVTLAITTNVPTTVTDGTNGTDLFNLTAAAPEGTNGTDLFNVTAGTNGTDLFNVTAAVTEGTNGTELFNVTAAVTEGMNGTELFNVTAGTNGTDLFNVTEVSALNFTDTANVSTTPAPPPVNPIDTILGIVANKTREPALQLSIDKQIGLFSKYLNRQTAYYQKSMDKLTRLMDQVTQRNASTNAALTNIRGLISGMITKPTQKVSLESLLRAASTIQTLKDQVALAQSQNSISKVRTLIIDAARVANVKI